MNRFITTNKGGAGWFAVLMWLNEKDNAYPFWEPWETGMGRYATQEEAAREGKEWARLEEVEFHD